MDEECSLSRKQNQAAERVTEIPKTAGSSRAGVGIKLPSPDSKLQKNQLGNESSDSHLHGLGKYKTIFFYTLMLYNDKGNN